MKYQVGYKSPYGSGKFYIWHIFDTYAEAEEYRHMVTNEDITLTIREAKAEEAQDD